MQIITVLKQQSWEYFHASLDFKAHVFTASFSIYNAYVLLKQQKPEIHIQ